jgi:hypothetical protein
MPKDLTTGKAKHRILSWRKTLEPPLPTTSQQPFPTSEEVVTLQVGLDATGRSIRVRKDLFHSVTKFSNGATGSHVIFPPALVKDDPIVFDMFVDWLDLHEDPRPYIPLQYSPEPWRSHAATAWVFGKKIRAAKFERYALSQFITNCATVELAVWKYIEMRARDKSSLRRFSNHWIAWNHHLAPAEQSEYKDLSAAKLARLVNDDTIDPRIFDLDHWDSVCGDDISSSCIHDPVVRENLAQKRLSIAQKQRPDEWGRDWETKSKAGQKESVDSPPSSPKAKVSGNKLKKAPPLPPPLAQKFTSASSRPIRNLGFS